MDGNEPSSDAIRREIAQRWETQCELDQAVAAVRAGQVDRAIAAAESLRNRLARNRSVWTGLLALMMSGRNPAMLRYVQEIVTRDPALVSERYAGRTLLHEASAHGNLTMVELLLPLGADPNARNGGGHTPLYCLANRRVPGIGRRRRVVRALAQGGMDVNRRRWRQALHAAAR